MAPDSTSPEMWDRLWSEVSVDEWDRVSEAILAGLQGAIGSVSGYRILEAGAGSGRVSLRLAQEGAEVTLLDFSERALELARMRFEEAGCTAAFVLGHIESMPFADSTFDVVWNAGVLEHFSPERQTELLAEMGRVVRPDGYLVCMVPNKRSLPYLLAKWYLEMTGQWLYGQEFPVESLRPVMDRAGLEVVEEFSVGYDVGCEMLANIPSLSHLGAILDFHYNTLSGTDKRALPGYLLVTVARCRDSRSSAYSGGSHARGQAGLSPTVSGVPTPRGATGILAHSRDIICLSSINWTDLWQRPQQLMSRFARYGHRVVFVDSQTYYVDVSDADPRQQLRQRLIDAIIRITRWDHGVAHLPRVSMGRRPSGDMEDLTPDYVDALQSAFGFREPIFWVYLPTWGHSVAFLKSRGKVVYDCVDDFAAFSDATPDVVAGDRILTAHADIVLATASRLVEGKKQFAARIHHSPNGVDPDFFRPSRHRFRRPGQRRIIGFVGALADWVDFELIRDMARLRPAWRFVLVGPTLTDVSSATKYPNVELWGRQPYSRLPAILKQFDVGTIPFRVNNLTHHANPIKVYEYLAAGLPVVARRIPELEPLADYVRFADTAEEFVSEIERVLTLDSVEEVERRIRMVRRFSWERIARESLTLVLAHEADIWGDRRVAKEILMTGSDWVGDSLEIKLEIAVHAALDSDPVEAIRIVNEQPSLVHEVAERLYRRGHLESAVVVLDRFHAMVPGDPDTLYNLAALLAEKGEYSASLAHIARYLESVKEAELIRQAVPLLTRCLAGLGREGVAAELTSLLESESSDLHTFDLAARVRELF